MSKALYRSTILELGIGIASSFSGMVLNAGFFGGKRALHLYMGVMSRSLKLAISFATNQMTETIALPAF